MLVKARFASRCNFSEKSIAKRAKACKNVLMDINHAALKVIRERSGLTRTALAEAAGIKQPHLSNIEAGRRTCSPSLAKALAEALNIPLNAILANSKEQS